MATISETKRQNFNVTPEQEAELLSLQSAMNAPSVKDAVLRAVRLALVIEREIRAGKRLVFTELDGKMAEVLLPEFEHPAASDWTYLTERPHAFKKQLFVKGRRLTAAQVWLDMQTNRMSAEEAAENWELPLEAIEEIRRYCETHRDLVQMEADEEKLFLQAHGVALKSAA